MNNTRNTNLLTLLILAAFVMFACNLISPQGISGALQGSGNVVTQEEVITGFNRLEVSDGFHVDIRQGDTFSVVIRADDNLIEDVEVVKEGDTLKIGLKPESSFSLQNVTLEADVTMPALRAADLSGGSHLGGEIQAGDVTFDLNGGSHVTLSGSAENLTVDVNGGSHAKLANLAVVDAYVKANGGSHVTVDPSGRLDAEASGGSHVRYLGSPTLGTIDADVSSSIKPE
jgi:hypothetical protein